MDKKTIMRAFNTVFFEFLSDVLCVYPDNHEIKYAYTSFENIKRANPSILVKIWLTAIYMPYREVIDAGNISFFFEKNYADDLSELGNSKQILDMIDKIRQPIREMTPENQTHAAKYILDLSKLSLVYSTTQA
jgi:hypothetical protein